ncbi:acetaldehyde dehydrogenase [Candidatus Woesearchaeota archaeon]|nr:acetaldehyde dehydrogenase [Candidatus Woesearchaeota archaeon]
MKGLDPDLRALQEVRDHVARAKAAVKAVAHYDQDQTDRLCKAMAEAGARAALDLARVAVDETGIGRLHYKVLKNLFGSEGTWESVAGERTVGFISRDEATGLHEVATPVGVVAGIIPTTNPTSTALFKSIIAVKGRNAIVISPHPRSRRCILETAEVMRRAIERAGGPPDLVQCLANPTIESTGALMKHRNVSVILATGGGGLVHAAYSSGKPAYGVGPGNVPAYVDRSADVRAVAEAIVSSQSFDNATLCCSEQALVLDEPIVDAVLGELQARGAHLCSDAERAMLETYCNHRGHMNPDIVGLDPWRVAEGAGFSVPRSTTVLLAHQDGVGPEHPLSIEILCPLLSLHVVDGWRMGCEVATSILHNGGLGHTLAVHAREETVLDAFFLEKPASRIIVNGPSSAGAVGFSTHLTSSFSLGCGPQAGNITSDNITARHLINIKRAAYPRRDWREVERKAHERAAALTGAGMPRGSGMPGDPAVGGAGRESTDFKVSPAPRPPAPGSGKQELRPSASPAVPSPSAVQTIPTLRPAKAPTFTQPASRATAAPVAAAPARKPVAAGLGVDVGSALSVGEIRSIFEQAGEGCPMGPCQGCALKNVSTGRCEA